MQDSEKENILLQYSTKLSFYFIILGVLGFVILLTPFILELGKTENYGIVGDTVGGILNPLVAIGVGLLTYLAFMAQFQANKQVQNQFKIQQFESQFYEMIRLHKENVNEMKISGYDRYMSKTYNMNGAETTITRTEVERFVDGRKVFVSMAKELIACFEFCQLYDFSNAYTDQQLLELAYHIFFFGSESAAVWSRKVDEPYIKMIKTRLKHIRDLHKESVGGTNEFPNGFPNGVIKLHIKYAPFTGHESRLGHYYRHLYGTVKFVVEKEKAKLITYKQAREYLKILRIQMSNHEQLMLYYNYIIGFGEKWEDEGYLTKYRMLHNLPITKVKYATPPREHFNYFIDTIVDEDSMFEWGDVDSKDKKLNIIELYNLIK